MTFWGVVAFWFIVVLSFIAGAIHGRGVERGAVIDSMEGWGPNVLQRLERLYGLKRGEDGRYEE